MVEETIVIASLESGQGLTKQGYMKISWSNGHNVHLYSCLCYVCIYTYLRLSNGILMIHAFFIRF